MTKINSRILQLGITPLILALILYPVVKVTTVTHIDMLPTKKVSVYTMLFGGISLGQRLQKSALTE